MFILRYFSNYGILQLWHTLLLLSMFILRYFSNYGILQLWHTLLPGADASRDAHKTKRSAWYGMNLSISVIRLASLVSQHCTRTSAEKVRLVHCSLPASLP